MKPCKLSAHSDKHSDGNKRVVKMSWNFVRFHEIINQREISDFYLDKQKSFVPKKILSVPCTIDELFFQPIDATAAWRPNFPHQRLCTESLGPKSPSDSSGLERDY